MGDPKSKSTGDQQVKRNKILLEQNVKKSEVTLDLLRRTKEYSS